MHQIGYAVVQDGEKLLGVVQSDLAYARVSRDRYRRSKVDDTIQVVPVYVGAPIPEAVQAPITLSKGTAT